MATSTTELTYSTIFALSLLSCFVKNAPRFARRSSAAARKINEMVKRIRLVKVHVCILSHLKGQMPLFYGKTKKQVRERRSTSTSTLN